MGTQTMSMATIKNRIMEQNIYMVTKVVMDK